MAEYTALTGAALDQLGLKLVLESTPQVALIAPGVKSACDFFNFVALH